ncbi:nucleotidyl transferase [Candidatus Thioglobus autotrophicus]|jgi:L-glutamine-phosphate cytidylyltransferase|uniref:Nucleotidyl transferase n=1 Tax=Candidatus Thioglobus autotrophicus TaxID=1705394 RepID=A0A0M5LEE4_9GAMM|nr:phosphocholine cytidylyltransferase family protein [Candidatus Thioglobus autotrophicus]ALE52160.1 nucleotidyl transferase [Candidatus Thioglobus autotrophicus]
MVNKNLKVIILAAGEGTRLRPYTLDRPKCMVEIDGVSLIDRQLEVLKSEGIDDIVIIGGYKSEMLKRGDIKLKVNARYFETNMVWTLFSAEEELEGDVIVSYGDIVYSKNILKALIKSKADIAVTIDKKWEGYWRERNENPLDDAETLKLRKDGTISEIGQKPSSLEEIEGQYMGLMKFSSEGVRQIKSAFHSALESGKLLGKEVENSYMTDLLQFIVSIGGKVASVQIDEDWVEVDTVEDLHAPITLERVKRIRVI